MRDSESRLRWLELRNKIAAYRLFQGRGSIRELDPYQRIFAAEGFSYRRALQGSVAPGPSAELSPIALRAGAGLYLAEQSMKAIHHGRRQNEVIEEFSAACRRNAPEGFAGIMEEALGFVAQTMYPHLMASLEAHLDAANGFQERFWHGAGRGIYFAPGNLPVFRAAPWRGVEMCLRESPHDSGKRNALSGFCFALTLVNLRQPEILETFSRYHAAHADECLHGIRSAMAVWALARGDTREVAEEDRRRPERLFSIEGENTHEQFDDITACGQGHSVLSPRRPLHGVAGERPSGNL